MIAMWENFSCFTDEQFWGKHSSQLAKWDMIKKTQQVSFMFNKDSKQKYVFREGINNENVKGMDSQASESCFKWLYSKRSDAKKCYIYVEFL